MCICMQVTITLIEMPKSPITFEVNGITYNTYNPVIVVNQGDYVRIDEVIVNGIVYVPIMMRRYRLFGILDVEEENNVASRPLRVFDAYYEVKWIPATLIRFEGLPLDADIIFTDNSLPKTVKAYQKLFYFEPRYLTFLEVNYKGINYKPYPNSVYTNEKREYVIKYLPSTLPWLNQIVQGYYIERLLGEGATSYVFLARGSDNKKYVMKIFKIDKEVKGKTRTLSIERFKELSTEFSNLVTLSEKSERIVKVYGAYIDILRIKEILDGKYDTYVKYPPFILMEYMRGGDLEKMINNVIYSPNKEKIIARIVHEIALALYEIHKVGMVHLDIKPKNIFFSNQPVNLNVFNNTIKLGDLGSATRVGMKPYQITIEYAPPEQLIYPANPMMDIYALGSVAYKMMFGITFNPVNMMEKLFDAIIYGESNLNSIYNRVISEITNKLSKLRNSGLEGVIKMMLNPDPVKRPTSKEVAELTESYNS